MNQKEAVFSAISSIVELRPNVDIQTYISKPQLSSVYDQLFLDFKAGSVELRDRDTKSDEWLKKYIPGLVNNWMRKDTRLNGGGEYVTKNPGSRQGSGDEMLRQMKLLLSMTQDSEARKEIETEIAKRMDELKPKTTIKVEALPPALRRFVQQ